MQDAFDIAVIGAGPAGLAAAIAAAEAGASVLVVEREGRLGGILKQCIHDGFGIERYGERLTGPEYAHRDIARIRELGIECATSSFVLDIAEGEAGFALTLTSRSGIRTVAARALVLACGCRERTAKQVAIHGDRPSGVFTAGCAQNLVNIRGVMPGKRVVVLGSGDIGLIMARRLTLEGAEVLGVFEARPRPSGLARNIAQCLDDFSIPLHLSRTVTRTFGRGRLEAVEIARVDERMRPIAGTEERIACDTLILSVGLIPENELAERLGVPLDAATHGPVVDQRLHALHEGVFAAGNCLSVMDLVDHVSEHGQIAGAAAAAWCADFARAGHAPGRDLAEVSPGRGIASCVPQRIDRGQDLSNVTFYIRCEDDYRDARVVIVSGGRELFVKRVPVARQAEALRISADLSGAGEKIEVGLA